MFRLLYRDFELLITYIRRKKGDVNRFISNKLLEGKIMDKRQNFCIVLPPPNVTGTLHIGHALNSTLQDILIRWRRMCGDDVLWQPGVDHAGIATQMVVTRELEKEHGVGCVSGMDRDTFLSHVWAWKKKSGSRIKEQLDRLGASCNWERERFTMDEEFSRAVRHAFVTLYREGLIFRDHRLVNWDPYLETAISDLEVVSKTVQGTLWYFQYPIEGCKQTITVATTRPETIPGDTGIAVHPDDKRYRGLIGKFAILPMVGRRIPIVADSHVDQTLGTGAVKITPAHDMDDFQIGKRHNLRSINIMDVSAHIQLAGNEDFLEGLPEESSREVSATIDALDGLDRFAARDWIVKHCGETGILEKAVDHEHVVPFGDRSGVPIEPYLTYQWFVDTADMAKKAIEVVEDGSIKFHPESVKKTYLSRLETIEPWCISRQLMWGHRIPLWYSEDGEIFCAISEEDAHKQAESHFRFDVELTQDTDVLDTWFSSALWAFVTLGWPNSTIELEKYFPSSILMTGFDILFFWVTRMIMFSLYFMKDLKGDGIIPFREVYIHALVRDEKGQKMSKSAGNTIDPLDLCDKYGVDALRFTLASTATMGQDIRISESKMESCRNFCTKIRNAVKYCLINEALPQIGFNSQTAKHPINKWIVGRSASLVESVSSSLKGYHFNRAADRVYSHVREEFCDLYLEFSKVIFSKGSSEEKEETKACMGWAVERVLQVLHPFMPFHTQGLSSLLQCSGSLQVWPTLEEQENVPHVDLMVVLIAEIRSIRASLNISHSQVFCISLGDLPVYNLHQIIEDCAKVKCKEGLQGKSLGLYIGSSKVELFIFDELDSDNLISTTTRKIERVNLNMSVMNNRLSNPEFIEKASPFAIDKSRKDLETLETDKQNLQKLLCQLKGVE
jgi:valyl-tRNA synthetase